MALAILATVIVGFSRSFIVRPPFPDWPSPPEMIFYVVTGKEGWLAIARWATGLLG